MITANETPADTSIRDDRATAKSALLPQRHRNHDLFICDVLDAIPKDDMASMEHPIFSLATKADTRILRYEHRNVVVEIAPSVKGLATIYDTLLCNQRYRLHGFNPSCVHRIRCAHMKL
jgi:Replication initiator protein A